MYELHKRASFQLRGWASNRPEVLCKMENKYKSDSASLGDKEHTERTLGLIWNIKRDIISFSKGLRNTPEEVMEGLRPPTKREITSAVMSVFDPLGLASPITIQAKSLIQQVWRTGISWNEEVTHELHMLFCKWISEVKKLGHLEVPRPVAEGVGKGVETGEEK
ncbi:unnamed protein product [Parnassius apollo]|uniref:(apollo) hypothetical protein n=1 Tax=Parnassius apollo TaxID=110799 RepID=A0A8S3XUT0_PARAO|nr:unnamed protein product [Parnassius apollo]